MPYSAVNTQIFIPHQEMTFTTGTWAVTTSSGISYNAKTATDETSTVTIPFSIPRRSDAFGLKLKTIKFVYRCTTADLDAVPGVTLHRVNHDLVVAGATGDVAATAITVTNDGVVTADANDRLLTITISDPTADESVGDMISYVAQITLNAAATTVLRVYGAFVEYEALT